MKPTEIITAEFLRWKKLANVAIWVGIRIGTSNLSTNIRQLHSIQSSSLTLHKSRVHNLSYCPVYKAGSTTWFYNLCLLNGIPEEALANSSGQISIIARSVLPEMELSEAVEVLEKSRKLLVVRHPFERLLSAYRDKLENSVAGREHGTLHFYKKYGSKIVAKFRDERIAPPRSDQVIRPKDIPPPAGIEPTWREFVQYLIHTDLASYGDDHWMPYYLFCTPCLIRFNIIAKVETLWRDQIFAIHELGMENQLTPKWRHSNAGSSSAAEIYFTQLTPNLVRQLYEKFKLDFELFDYSPMDYYEYATGDAP
ncbi:carbohydrate sulfotransferase 11 isoform X2 [Neodiprion pinetum]|uniref:Carbohydrate sulfotransferase n=1 Tax=Neodiprion lecontei TaxID=441921 RepID=A0ABM3FF47_NEOLC|nr:carbohydrate sulfotransferase 11-like isoform X2 [Neodiprion pinetum]XP_046586640.1 carbohydrate sulfotransferase 11 isoform X2 [Neodiprion lecontei]